MHFACKKSGKEKEVVDRVQRETTRSQNGLG
jgi:hypothetical protein